MRKLIGCSPNPTGINYAHGQLIFLILVENIKTTVNILKSTDVYQ